MSDIWHDPLFLAAVKKGGAGGTASGDIVTFNAPKAAPLKALTLSIDPVQDLHGYDSPWPAGGGKNLLNWTNASTTIRGVTFTVNSDGSIIVNGTADDGDASFYSSTPSDLPFTAGSYILSGCPSGGSSTTYFLNETSGSAAQDVGNGATIVLNEGRNIRIRIVVRDGVTVNNLVFWPMIRLSSISDATFAPYSNLCPISGWDGANLWRTGKNLLDLSFLEFDDSTYSHAYYPATTPQVTDYVKLMERFIGKTVVLSATVTGTQSAGTQPIGTIRLVNSSGDVFQLRPDTPATVPDMDYSNVSYLIIYGSTNGASVSDIQLELGSTATPYTPYTGTTIPVTFTEAGTVYGGTLDVLSGVLRVTHASETFKWGDGWGATDLGSFIRKGFTLANYCKDNDPTDICNIAPRSPSYNADSLHFYVNGSSGNKRTYVFLPEDTDSNTDVQVRYTLAQPITYTLTAQQLDTLAGQNVVWGDAGEVDLEYAGGGVSKDMMLAAILHEARQ